MTNYNVKHEIDYSDLSINEELFNLKEQGKLNEYADTYELPKFNKTPRLNQIVKIKFSDAILYGKIVLIMKMSSGKYRINVNLIDVIKKEEEE